MLLTFSLNRLLIVVNIFVKRNLESKAYGRYGTSMTINISY